MIESYSNIHKTSLVALDLMNAQDVYTTPQNWECDENDKTSWSKTSQFPSIVVQLIVRSMRFACWWNLGPTRQSFNTSMQWYRTMIGLGDHSFIVFLFFFFFRSPPFSTVVSALPPSWRQFIAEFVLAVSHLCSVWFSIPGPFCIIYFYNISPFTLPLPSLPFHRAGQFITTSAEVTPNGGLVRESPQNGLKLS